jgi:hypothetical protein
MAARNTPVSASFATPARVRPQASTPSFSRRSPPCKRRRTELYGERAAFAALLLACQAEAHRRLVNGDGKTIPARLSPMYRLPPRYFLLGSQTTLHALKSQMSTWELRHSLALRIGFNVGTDISRT